MRAVQQDDPLVEYRYRIAAELEKILQTRAFEGAPVMTRLLRFLVTEMLSGRGKQLKAYTVAVDAIGRTQDFDPLVDSYPRVQVGRLRKMLEAHYARHAQAEGYCLVLRRGSYDIGFARLDRAYPDLARHTPEAAHPPEPPMPTHTRRPPSRIRYNWR